MKPVKLTSEEAQRIVDLIHDALLNLRTRVLAGEPPAPLLREVDRYTIIVDKIMLASKG